MAFKKFEGTHQRQEDRITITSSYSVGFPTKFYKNNGIADFRYVVLFFDEEERAVGIHFTNDEGEKGKFSIIRSGAGYGGSVVVRSFFKANNINPQVYRGRYQWTKQEMESVGLVYVIKLKEREKGPTMVEDP